MSSPPTISQDHDDDEAEQSDSGSSAESDVSGSDVTEKSDIKTDSIDVEEAVETIYVPTQIIYESRNILNLAHNVWNSGRFIQFTVLPENNVNCFFQNRAQYWRLANNNLNAADTLEKCSCCDFSHPPMLVGNVGKESATAKNAITDSLMTFLKNNVADYQNPVANNSSSMPMQANQMNNVGHRRMYNNSAPYSAYQMMQQQQQQQQYQNNQNNGGYYGNGGGYNQMNNGGVGGGSGYNGTALTLLNLMNASRNVTSAGAAFQATLNNSTRYFNNNNMNTNNGFGLYKQF